MQQINAIDNTLAFSYLSLRRTVGLLGVLLPFVLAIGLMMFFNQGIQSSISYYYHTAMGDVFVGIVCVIGIFLYSYKGYEPIDDIVGNFACIFAIGLALFPTHADPAHPDWAGHIHSICAALFFLTLSYFSICLFTKTGSKQIKSNVKLLRNQIYLACGYIMLLCIFLIGLIHIPALAELNAQLKEYSPVFWFEAIAIVAFGISWLIKGEAILHDIS